MVTAPITVSNLHWGLADPRQSSRTPAVAPLMSAVCVLDCL